MTVQLRNLLSHLGTAIRQISDQLPRIRQSIVSWFGSRPNMVFTPSERQIRRRITLAALDRKSLHAATSNCDSLAEPDIYVMAYKNVDAGRNASIEFVQLNPQIVDEGTYEKRPKNFTPKMLKEYDEYKAAEKGHQAIERKYNEDLEKRGGIKRMTVSEHLEMIAECKRTSRSDDMLLMQNLSVFPNRYASICYELADTVALYRASFERMQFYYKYPYAYGTYKGRVRHWKVFRKLMRRTNDKVVDHVCHISHIQKVEEQRRRYSIRHKERSSTDLTRDEEQRSPDFTSAAAFFDMTGM